MHPCQQVLQLCFSSGIDKLRILCEDGCLLHFTHIYFPDPPVQRSCLARGGRHLHPAQCSVVVLMKRHSKHRQKAQRFAMHQSSFFLLNCISTNHGLLLASCVYCWALCQVSRWGLYQKTLPSSSFTLPMFPTAAENGGDQKKQCAALCCCSTRVQDILFSVSPGCLEESPGARHKDDSAMQTVSSSSS